MKALVVCAIVAFAIVGVPAGSGPAAGSTPHVLQFNFDESDVATLNPFLATAGPNGPLSELTSGEFVRFDAHGNAIPELVTTVPTKANHGISLDGRTITWHLRHGVKWSDGVPFDAADVTYTFRVAMDRENNIPVRAPWERLAAVTALDPYTVVFNFKAPYSLFLADYFSTQSFTCVLPKHVLGPGTKINQAPFNALPIGLGPFRYTAFDRGSDVKLEANPYYWRGHAKLQRIVYKMITEENTDFTELQTGELDLWALVNGPLAQRVRSLPGIAIATAPGGIMSGAYFNTQRPAVHDPRVRQALRFATDQTTMLKKTALGNGIVQRSLIASVAQDYLALPPIAYDPKHAEALLDAAGWHRGPDGARQKNGVPLAIEIAIPTGYAPSASAANILHADWGAIGIAVNIHAWADSQFFAPASAGGVLQTGNFDAALFSNGGSPLYATLTSYYTCADFPPNGFNTDRYCNPRVDRMNARYAQTFDAAQRKEIAAGFQRLIDADVPAVVFYQRIYLSAYTNRLRGYHPSTFSSWGDPLELDM